MNTLEMLGKRELSLAQDAAEWRLLSMLFECPSQAWRADVSALMGEVTNPLLKSAAHDALEEADEGLFHHTFGPGGPAPAREASYHQTLQLGFLLAELESFYNAFAFQNKSNEAPDHIAVETSFMAYLRLKEAYAAANGEEKKAAIAADAATQFLNEHLRNIAHPLAAHLENSGISYLTKAGQILAQRVAAPEIAPSLLPIIQEPEDSEDLTCGTDCKE